MLDDIVIVPCIARINKLSIGLPNRMTESTGAVSIAGLKGEAKANAMMKAETKAKRRAVLSLVGLSMLDSTEVETIPDREAVVVDQATGEIMAPPERPKPLPTPERKADPWERLQERIVREGLPWPNFEAQVLGKAQEEYIKEGGTPGAAWKLYESATMRGWGERTQVDDPDQVTMDGLASP